MNIYVYMKGKVPSALYFWYKRAASESHGKIMTSKWKGLGGRSAATPAVYISRLYNTVQYSTVQAGCLYIPVVQYSTLHTVQAGCLYISAVQYSTVQ